MALKDYFQEKIKAGSFLRSVLTVTSGTVISQLILIIASPFITRLYSPADMGVLASYTAITSILGTVITGCYDQAVVLPEIKRQTNAVVYLSVIIAAISSGVITILSFFFDNFLITILNLQTIQKIWFYLLGFFVFLIGVDSVLNQYAIKSAHFKIIATTQVTQQIATNGLKVLLGSLKLGVSGLFSSMFLGQIIRVIKLFIHEHKSLFLKEDFPNRKEILLCLKRYKNFPLVSSWSALLNSSSVQLPVILFTSLFSPSVAGYYSLSHRILSLPVHLIGSSVGNVFLERAAKEKDNIVALGKITLDVYKKMLLIGSIIFSFVTFYGDLLFYFVFGDEWLQAGQYAQWMSIWIIFSMCYSPISILYIVKEKQLENLFFQIILFFARCSIFFIVVVYNTVDVAFPIYCITSAIVYLCGALRLLRILKIPVFVILKVYVLNSVSIFFLQYCFSLLIRNISFFKI